VEQTMLIGKQIRIADARNESIAGKNGLVIDETKNTLTIRGKDGKQHTIIKEQIITIEESP
jgi:RNase P/RNase MRP subunit p29